jgi:hypothetical protein
MGYEIVVKVLVSLIVSIITGIFGFLLGKIKTYKQKIQEKENEGLLFKEALMTMLQSTLTNTYYVYESQKEIPDYVYKNWLNSYNIYGQLGGNDYIHVLADKMKKWDFEKTDILKGIK